MKYKAISQDHTLSQQLGARTLASGRRVAKVPPVLLLHGFTDSADTWRPVMTTVAAASVYAVAVDLPQFGTCERAPDANLIEAHDTFIERAINCLDDGSGVVVVGNSFGGWGAIRAATRHPAVRGVVAISPAGLPTKRLVGNPLSRLLIDRLVSVPIPRGGCRIRDGQQARLIAVVMGHVYARAGSTQPVDRELIDYYRSHIRYGDLRLWLKNASVMLRDITEPGALDVALLSAPLHIIWGTHDPFVSPSGANYAYRQNPAMVTVDVLENVGHCAQIQCPEVVADSIVRLCQTVE